MTTRQRVISILRSPEAMRIRFSFDSGGTTHTIRRRTFEQVARAVENRRIRVIVSTTFGAGVGALYHPDSNTIETPPVIGRANQGLLLHEAVHAAFDLQRTAIPAVDDEAAAYVADALYFRMTGLARLRWNAQLHAFAGNIADSILRDYQAGRVSIPTADPLLWGILRAFIISNPTYLAGPASNGGSYLHDGV
ncbi:hypothetical protein [Leptolyngbya sp. 7M]|uniref:hypothetical protein n=1 Tax=Leptolyngbya sp. 7M TaxID=2812896 RepID=UPI001B8B9593|nr:hypothetical protein [Leptolyngbya sp. 7M]QYO66850.1 hypothetical protein JVX88_08615 [Leptolyngbya sp. 7M]